MTQDKRFVESKLVAREGEELKENVKAELNQPDPEGEAGKKAIEKATSSVLKVS